MRLGRFEQHWSVCRSPVGRLSCDQLLLFGGPKAISDPVPRLPAAVFVPKSIREPHAGDLREDMTEKLAAGWSRTRVKCFALSQVAILVIRCLWSTGFFRALRGGS